MVPFTVVWNVGRFFRTEKSSPLRNTTEEPWYKVFLKSLTVFLNSEFQFAREILSQVMRSHQLWDSVEEYNSSRGSELSAIVAKSFGLYRGNRFWPLESTSSKILGKSENLRGTRYLSRRLKSITASNITRDSRARVNPLLSVKVANIAHASLGMTLRT